jgi:hypothetical protein
MKKHTPEIESDVQNNSLEDISRYTKEVLEEVKRSRGTGMT